MVMEPLCLISASDCPSISQHTILYEIHMSHLDSISLKGRKLKSKHMCFKIVLAELHICLCVCVFLFSGSSKLPQVSRLMDEVDKRKKELLKQ